MELTRRACPLQRKRVREGTELAVPLEGAIRNMAVIDVVFRSAESSQWEEPV